MSLTQWLTRSTPIVRCASVMNATFSFVPTPSALATRMGSFAPVVSSRNSPPNEPISDSTPAVNVDLGQRLDAAHGLVAGVDVDAGCLVVHGGPSSAVRQRAAAPSVASEIELVDQLLGQPARSASRRRPPSSRAARRRRTALPRDPPRACRSPRRGARGRRPESFCAWSTCSISGVLRSATLPTASASGARIGSADGMPCVEQDAQRLGVALDGDGAESGRRRAHQLLIARDCRRRTPAPSAGSRGARSSSRRAGRSPPRPSAAAPCCPCAAGSASVASARLSPIFPSASTASSCSGPSSLATSIELRRAHTRA